MTIVIKNKRKNMKKLNLLTLLLLAGLSHGCAGGEPTPQDKSSLQTKTANFFGTTPENITISNFESGLIMTGYKAHYQGTIYNCVKHNMYGYVNCKKPGY